MADCTGDALLAVAIAFFSEANAASTAAIYERVLREGGRTEAPTGGNGAAAPAEGAAKGKTRAASKR